MARAGVFVDEAIPLPGGAGDATRRILRVIGADRTLRIVLDDTMSYRVTRRYRPIWALPLVMVTRTEDCRLSVAIDDRQSRDEVTLRILGRLPRTVLEAIRLVLERPAAVLPIRDPLRDTAPDPEGLLDAPTWPSAPSRDIPAGGYPIPVGPGALPSPPVAGGASAPATQSRDSLAKRPSGWLVVFDSGREESLVDLALVGREPATASGERARLIGIDDPDYSISKTHLAVGVDIDGVWVMDRHSLNGTSVTRPGAASIVCRPGERVRVDIGESVHFGERRFTLRAVS